MQWNTHLQRGWMIMVVLLAGWILVACDDNSSPATAQIEATRVTIVDAEENTSAPVAVSAYIIPTPFVLPTPITKSYQEVANLTVLLSTEGIEMPKSIANVYIFANDILVFEGKTLSGVYRTEIPNGTYDVMVSYPSLPDAGHMEEGFEISGNDTHILEVFVPTEGDLALTVTTASGGAPSQDFNVSVYLGDEAIINRRLRTASAGQSTFKLRTDLAYDISITYPEADEIRQADINIDAGGNELVVALPIHENRLNVFVRDEEGGLTTEATVSILNTDGIELSSATVAQDKFTVVLPAEAEYIVRVEQVGALAQEKTVFIPATGLVQEVFEVLSGS